MSQLPSTETANDQNLRPAAEKDSPQPDSLSSLRYDYNVESFDESSHYGRLLRRVGHNKKVLELGSSTGFLSEAMTRHFGCTVTGVEVDKDAADAARAKGLEVFVLDLDQADLTQALAGRRFDVVLCADVLEHLRDPVRTVSQLSALLADDGYVICSIPHVGHGDIRLSLLSGRMPYRPMGLLDHTHMKFFTRVLVEELFENAGMRVDKVERNRWQMTRTEVQGRLPSALSGLTDFIAADPESETYQFLVKASPYREAHADAALPRVDVVVIDQDSVVADDLYQKYLAQIHYPTELLKYWFVSESGGIALADRPKGEAAAYQDSDFRTFRFSGQGESDPQRTMPTPVIKRGQSQPKNIRSADINVAATLAQVARGSDAKYIFVLLANALPGANCLRALVKQAQTYEAALPAAPEAAGQVAGPAAGQVRTAQIASPVAGQENGQATAQNGGNSPELMPLLAARAELRPGQEPQPDSADGALAWHNFSAMLIPRDFLIELKSLDPNLWTVKAQAADMCFRAWASGRRVLECAEANYFSNGPTELPGDYDDTVADGLRLRRRWGTLRNVLAYAKYAAGHLGKGEPLVWLKTANHVVAALAIETPLRSTLSGSAQSLVVFGGPGASEIGPRADRRL